MATKPRKLSILSHYKKSIISTIKCDCEYFLEEFEKEKSLNYADFANVWQRTNFTNIFADQQYVAFLRVLCETCFFIVKKYIMFQSSLYIRIGAFYLLYGLYYKQPIEGMVKIRVTLAEYKMLKELMEKMKNQNQLDVIYIFVKMKSDNVFLYVAEPTPLGIEFKTSSTIEKADYDDTFSSRGTESSLNKFKDLMEDDCVKNLEKTCNDYDAALKKYTEKCPGLIPFRSSVINELHTVHHKIFKQSMLESESSTSQSESTVALNKCKVRLKAMKNKTAEYRGSKTVLTAMDLDNESISGSN